MSQKSHDYLFKILLVGDSSVGKSSIIIRYIEQKFSGKFMTTIGIDFKIKTIEINGKKIKLQIWDTAGQERFRSMTYSYYRGAKAILLVYDITCAKSFFNLSTWIRNIEQFAEDNVLVYIVGNKCDCSELRAIPKTDGEDLAKKFSASFFETSAKESIKIDLLFRDVSEKILNKVLTEKLEKNQTAKRNNSFSINTIMEYTNSSLNGMRTNCCN